MTATPAEPGGRALLDAWRARWEAPVQGWDLSPFESSVRTAEPPWSYDDLATAALARAGSVVDLGTGGGEWLLTRADLPEDTRATEGWIPNIPLARAALDPRGIEVATYDADAGDPLPYPDRRFDLVLDRHEAYSAPEVRRVLRPGGTFLTQQVDGRNMDDLMAAFGGSAPYPEITLAPLRSGLEDAGLVVDLAQEWSGPITFADVGTMLDFLRLMPWQLPTGWSVHHNAEILLGLHRRWRAGEPLRFTERRLVLRARRAPD